MQPADANNLAARYDAWFSTPLGKAMDAVEAAAVLELATPQPGERTLDAGCGTGRYTRRLVAAGAHVTGVDADDRMLAAARIEAPWAELLQADVTALPFADATFDLTLAVTVLCFTVDPALAVREFARVTKPGGRVVLAELNQWSAWAAWRRVKGLLGAATWRRAHFYGSRDLARLLQDAGLRCSRTASAGYLPPGTPAWLCRHVWAVEGWARRLGNVGAALSLARGEVDS